MKRIAALAAALLLCSLPAVAAEEAPTSVADDPVAQRALAARLHSEADEIRAAAEKAEADAQKACWKTFLVSRCLDQAAQAHRDESLKAAKLDSRARAIERDLKRREIEEKDAARAKKDAEPRKP